LEVQAVPVHDKETESATTPEQVTETGPEENQEPKSEMPVAKADPEENFGETQSLPPEPTLEPMQISVPQEPISEHYILFSFCHGSAPKVLHAFSRKDIGQLIRDLVRNEDQFLFVVRGGELANLYKTKRGLIVQFDETKERIKVHITGQSRPVENGWIGESE